MRTLVVALAFALFGCVPSAEEEPAARHSAGDAMPAYVVRGAAPAGEGPGWNAVLLGGRLYLDSPTSAGWYAAAVPAPRTEGPHLTFAAPGVSLQVDVGACAQPDLKARFPDRIGLEWDGGRFEGCGGPRTPPEEMAGTVWELVRLGETSAPVSRSPAATLLFAHDGRLGGTLACNDGGVETSWDAGGFITRDGGFMQTAMGCNQPAAEALGTRFWNGMTDARRWHRDGERLFVTLGDGSEAELRLLI